MKTDANTQNASHQTWLLNADAEPWHWPAGKGITIVVLSVAMLAAPTGASAWRSFNEMEVNKVNDNVFEVLPNGMEPPNGTHYWCAAGQFAGAKLHAEHGAQIYVVRGMGAAETANRTHGAVQFTLDAAAAGVTPGPMAGDENKFNAGEHMDIGMAHTNCQ